MARPKKENTEEALTEKWKRRFFRSMKHQEENANQWQENEYLFYGRVGKEASDFDVALGWGLSQFLASQIYYQNPECLIHSKAQAGRELAKFVTRVTQFDMDEMDLRTAGNLALQDCFPYGYGAVIEDYENEIEEFEDENGEQDKEIKSQEYCFRRIQPRDILFDPDGIKLDLSDHKYIFVAYYPTIDELKEHKDKYKWLPDDIESSRAARPSDPEKGSGVTVTSTAAGSNSEKDPKYKQIRCYEIWDRVNRKIYYFAADKKRVIGEAEWPVKFDVANRKLYPVTLIAVTPQSKSFYPIPVISLIAPQLRAFVTVQRYYIMDLKTKWRAWATVEGFLPPVEVAKLTDITDPNVKILEFAKDTLEELAQDHPNQMPDLRQLLVQLQDSAIEKDYLMAFETLMGQVGQILGFADSGARGGMPKTRSAKEAAFIRDQQNRRTSMMANNVATFYREVVQKHVQFLQQTAEEKRYVKVVDEFNRVKEFREYNKDAIQGNFYFEVLVGSSMPKDTESFKQQYVQFCTMFLPYLQKEGYSIAPIVYELAEMYHVRNVDDFFRNQKAAAKMLAQILFAVSKGIQPGGKPIPPQKLIEAASATVQTILNKEEIAEAGREVAGIGQTGPAPGGGAPAGAAGESDASRMGMQ